jgi:hypothetical protein
LTNDSQTRTTTKQKLDQRRVVRRANAGLKWKIGFFRDLAELAELFIVFVDVFLKKLSKRGRRSEATFLGPNCLFFVGFEWICLTQD